MAITRFSFTLFNEANQRAHNTCFRNATQHTLHRINNKIQFMRHQLGLEHYI